MAQQTSNDVTRGTLVPDINGINALACKIGRELKNGANASYMFLDDNKAFFTALGISAPLLLELLKGIGIDLNGNMFYGPAFRPTVLVICR